ncbi:MAG: ATP synthase F1 subunit delta [Candidatus Dadabacteria bacterium]|nr:ATP synthase F1 subunit delta [Candidatus Dadabacteria bacterium]NIQ13591.1 ATP synthase F1 subunit delta [Candidatus Dadabacteria bacterium]
MATIATLRDLLDALIVSAKEENELQEVTLNIYSFYETLETNDKLKNALINSIFDIKERKAVISDFCSNSDFSHLTSGFLSLVVEMGKFNALLDSKENIISKLKEAAGRISADITSAERLADEDLERIKNALSRATGKDVEISVNIDPSIIGGIMAKVEDKVYDNTIKTQLERMRGVLSPS